MTCFLKQKFKVFLNLFFHLLNVQTNKQTLVYVSEANKPITSVCAPLFKPYKVLLLFALGPLDQGVHVKVGPTPVLALHNL